MRRYDRWLIAFILYAEALGIGKDCSKAWHEHNVGLGVWLLLCMFGLLALAVDISTHKFVGEK